MAGDVLDPRGYWSRPEAVASAARWGTALLYEIGLMSEAVEVAGGVEHVRRVEVIGAGIGREIAAVRDLVPRAVVRASDLAAPMIDECRRHVEVLGLSDVELEVGGLAHLSPSTPPADLLIAFGAVLGYLPSSADREDAFAAAGRLVRPGGALTAVVQQRFGRPDWAVWFAARAALQRAGVIAGEPGDRWPGDGEASVTFHHFRREELAGLLDRSGFSVVSLRSLRTWARHHGQRIPTRSPNPLVVVARRRTDG